MTKRILLALALAVSLGGAVAACNTPSGTSAPAGSTTTLPSTAPSTDMSSPSGTTTESMTPSAS